MELARDGLDEAVEEHPLDAHVVVEPLQVAETRNGTTGGQVRRGRGVAGEVGGVERSRARIESDLALDYGSELARELSRCIRRRGA